jgi:large conductance mechanosensitive channel
MATSAAGKGVAAIGKARKVRTVEEFRAFIMKGNVVDLAVGIIIGVAFSGVVTSLVNDVMMPPIGLGLGGVDFRESYVVLKDGPGNVTPPYDSLAAANADGAVTWRFGSFVNAVINFVIVAFSVFVMVKVIGRMRAKEEAKAEAAPTEKECPYCLMKVPIKAVKCGHCTSDIGAESGKAAA